MFARLFTFVVGHLYYAFLPLQSSCELILLGLGVHGTCSKNDKEKYKKFIATQGSGVVVYNHPTCYDHVVLMKELGGYLRFVMLSKYMVGPIRWFAEHLRVVEVKPQTGVSRIIKDAIENRKPEEPIVALSPAAGHISETDQIELSPFRTGGFLAKSPVLPVVIWYEPYEPWRYNETLWQTLKRRLCGKRLRYHMRVLDPLTCNEDETVAEYSERCRKYMSLALSQMSTNGSLSTVEHCVSPSATCFASSHLFLLCGIATMMRQKMTYATGMLGVFATSIWYHGFGTMQAKSVDIICNVAMATVYGIRLLADGNYIPLLWLLFAAFSYEMKWNHAYFVHLPIAIGFMLV